MRDPAAAVEAEALTRDPPLVRLLVPKCACFFATLARLLLYLVLGARIGFLRQYGARIFALAARHWALLRTLPFGTEGSLLRWEPQPHAAAPCTPYTSLLGASFKPDMAGRACILSGNRVAKVQTTSRGRVAMGLFWKSKKQKASRSRAAGYHATTPPCLLDP